MASIGVFIVGGAVEEEANEAGLTLLTARTMLKGTTTRTAAQIAEDAEMLGGVISASAGSDSFGWSLSVPKARLPEALELLGDVVQRPTIPEDSFETERSVALSDVAMLRDDMYRYPMRLASAVAFGGHPYGRPAMGTEESLRAISAEQAQGVAPSRVLESSAVIGIVADVDVEEVADLVARELDALTLKKSPKVGKPRVAEERQDRGGIARQGADRDRARVSRATAHRRFTLRRGADRDRRQRTRRPLLRRAARQAVARVHRPGGGEREAAGRNVRLLHRDVAGEGGRRARRIARRVREAARAAGDGGRADAAPRSTSSARTRSVRRAAARCSARCSTPGCSGVAWGSCWSTTRGCERLLRIRCGIWRGSTLIQARVEGIVRGTGRTVAATRY